MVHVVDDDAPVCQAIVLLLRSAGIAARPYSGGLALLGALPALGEGDAGCILTDLLMPGLDGLELLHRIRERGYLRPVIIMTGSSDVSAAVRVMKAGAADFLEKPFNGQTLLATLAAALAAPGPRVVDADTAATARLARLSPCEQKVLHFLAAGATNKAIARELNLSPRTVEAHRARLMQRLGVGSLAEAVGLTVRAELDQRGRQGAGGLAHAPAPAASWRRLDADA